MYNSLNVVSKADATVAYVVVRLAFGLAMFMHGASRFIAGIDKYAKPTIAGFDAVALPHGLVVFSVYAIPCAEVLIGIFLLFGFLTRTGILASAALMFLLIFGTSMEQNWAVLAIQLNYVLIVAILYLGLGLNRFCVDSYLGLSDQPASQNVGRFA